MKSQEIRKLAPEMDPLRIGMGWTVEDLEKPQILIESTYGQSHPGSAHLLELAQKAYNGAGAAGGMGFALMSYLHAESMPGVELILSQTGMEEKMKAADLVVIGEGKLDGQTAMGKAPAGVARLAKKYGKPVVAFAGCLGSDVADCKACGIDEYYAITPADMPLAQAMESATAYENLKNTATEVFAKKVRKYYADH